MVRAYFQASYRYGLLAILTAGLVYIVQTVVDKLADRLVTQGVVKSGWGGAIYVISIAAALGSFASHIYDNSGKLKLPDISPGAIELGILYDITLGVFAAFVTICFLTAASVVDPTDPATVWRLAGLALLAGMAGSRLIPRFRDAFNRRLDHIEKDFVEGKKSGDARDYYILANVATRHSDYLEAQEYYEKALRVDPTFIQAQAGLADAYVYLADQAPQNKDGLLGKALDYSLQYEANRLTSEERGGILLLKAGILWAMGKRDECMQALQRAIENFRRAAIPNDRLVNYIRANNKLMEAGSKDAAIKAVIETLGQ